MPPMQHSRHCSQLEALLLLLLQVQMAPRQLLPKACQGGPQEQMVQAWLLGCPLGWHLVTGVLL
jgi:hypothetical protein